MTSSKEVAHGVSTRIVQEIGPRSIGITLPNDWARLAGVRKGDRVLAMWSNGQLLVQVAFDLAAGQLRAVDSPGLTKDGGKKENQDHGGRAGTTD